MNQEIKNIVIVGGGTAGWITAGTLAANLANKGQNYTITLIESSDKPPIGVGEGTWPTMRQTLVNMGISESDFIRECDASFKQGAKFSGWVDGSVNDFYYHPLMLPVGFGQSDLCSAWSKQSNRSFSDTVCFQEAICESGLAPKHIRNPEYQHVANYAYHLDAGKFTLFLTKHCTTKLGIKHIIDEVINVKSADNDDIESLITASGNVIPGDLFIDCSGFESKLLAQHYGVEFVDHNDVLFIDSALAMQVPYEYEDQPIASHTISTAQTAGWIWDIGLQSRRGVGHVYSSRHISKDEAMSQLLDYVGPSKKNISVREIPIRCGHRQKFWHKNCVAVGLSAGFLEPLEASALMLIELSATMISQQMPATKNVMAPVAARFNEIFLYRWQKIIDFLKLHYMLSQRNDSEFWRDNRCQSSVPQSLKDLLSMWQYRAPADFDFDSNNEVFPAASYQYILYGMRFNTDFSFGDTRLETAKHHFEMNEQMKRKTLSQLPTNRALLNKINEFGLHQI